jgi:hypothetical protein
MVPAALTVIGKIPIRLCLSKRPSFRASRLRAVRTAGRVKQKFIKVPGGFINQFPENGHSIATRAQPYILLAANR